ncbi:MAG: hypothetical protein US86_C0001G0400 [Candidatus Daviesbacteria bacterium GW2011_GWA2_38_24]|uniref:PsbP C-terminal domain-containing protein n=1 Tax=Candidatus Daviesbacteria bacterium GW2011_GWA2_38_24 TaxID=1618422 RepID=A0A0G0JIB5_9BACT|nr:MAG: hypothetical protein US55_C0065G0008 [Candidatus Levybacteria bacterium GW2011_GWC2_37_7]KKQ67473.1 MAG: hypothetical protein US86_C0001G0400 [Candidatus Daviesbacteria bacterium GW2011_GWA2_38_24]KKQ79002.1 MAG: hypothetical protein UT01_C0053G0012 [Candidatus Daviesbacteria bacterium GW2011_GWA1_38_7]OGE23407.1 MAG: hypothetical protein A2688_01870 [Candidatus Daviesbacteria bacterium RIFCSPHIGHO2_01_FULL_38_8]
MKLPKSQKGLTPVLVLVIIALIGAGLFGAYYLGTQQSKSQNTQSQATLTPTSQTDETASWEEYVDSKHGYSIKYPQTLSYKQESKKEVWEMEFDNLNLRNYPEDEEWSKKDAISISLMVRTMQNPGDLKSWLEKISTTELIGGTVGPSAVDFTNYKIGDINALDFHTGAERIYRNVAFYQNGNLYVFILNSTGETGSRYDYNKNAVSIFDQILSTFKFTK